MGYSPEMVSYSPDNEELKKILISDREMLDYILILLLKCETTGAFDPESLLEEIDFVRGNIEWLDSLIPVDPEPE